MLFMVISLAQPSYLYLVNYLVLSWSEIFSLQPSSYISVYLILAVFLCIRFVERIDWHYPSRNAFIFPSYNFIMPPYFHVYHPFVVVIVVFNFKGDRMSFQRPTRYLCTKYQTEALSSTASTITCPLFFLMRIRFPHLGTAFDWDSFFSICFLPLFVTAELFK